MRQTLRSNNRELARALEVKKLELYNCQQLVLQLQERQQQLHLELATLRRVAGLKNDEVEEEVQARLKVG